MRPDTSVTRTNPYNILARPLLKWAGLHLRDLPWKQSDDPYHIWLSEIILQQTQVAQGIPYYRKFADRYPTVHELAAASEDQVLKDWQGLGYNTRARNLHAAAKHISQSLNGAFPRTYEGLLTLPGVGPYTAAAIASFAYDLPVPVIDTNVLRVMSRFLGLSDPVGSRALHRAVEDALTPLMSKVSPSTFNQAIMDFGALQCTPASPQCGDCPLARDCVAYQGGLVETLPVRKRKQPRRHRWFHYLVLYNDHGVLMRQRTRRDIWHRMYDFPLVECSQQTPEAEVVRDLLITLTGSGAHPEPSISTDQQVLTHQHIHCIFYAYSWAELDVEALPEGYRFVEFQKLNNFAVPKIIDCYFRSNSILL
ncbi:MAG: A/G-specific adenine glycosylase [Saprospiraceae bacterium]|nr:A/G-specific adenine glycosylase [Saprospiraceae bacterium]